MGQNRYILTAHDNLEAWLGQLLQSDRWHADPALDHATTYYDTFDWRLYGNENTLTLSETSNGRALVCRTFSGAPLAALQPAAAPGFIEDVPAGDLQDHLRPLVKMRRLLPQMTLRGQQQQLSLLNDDAKTVLRLTITSDRTIQNAQGAIHPLPPHIEILPVRGYRAALRRLQDAFLDDPGLESVTRPPLQEALDAAGQRPADYSSKLDLRLEADQPAGRALQTVLMTLLNTMRINLDGLHEDIDTEFLHDFRVAVRRTRSALSQLKGLLPPDELAPFRESFSWLGSLTGPSRDLDVYLLKFAAYRRLLSDHRQSELDPFHRFLVQRRNRELRAMTKGLKSPRFTALLSTWQTCLERERTSDPALPDADLPIKQVAARRIWKLFRRCLREGRAIGPDTPAEALHEMRKTCKKLRYLLEFFRSLFPPKAMGVLIKALKGLQDNLGDIQDFEVQSEAIFTFGLEMADRQQAPPATLLTMGMLSESLMLQQRQAREEFHRRFANFSDTHNRRLFRRMFGPPDRKGANDA